MQTKRVLQSIFALMLIGLFCLTPSKLLSAETSPEQVKVAITYNFLKMVGWTHLKNNENIRICVDASRSTFRAFQALNKRKLPGLDSDIEISDIRGNSKLFQSCHVLYFNKIDDPLVITELYQLADQPILVLSEAKEDVYYRSMVNIYTKSEVIRGKSSTRIAYLLNECRVKHAQIQIHELITQNAELVNRLCDPIEFTLKVLKYVSWPNEQVLETSSDKVMLFCNSEDNNEISLDSIHGRKLGERSIEVIELSPELLSDCDAIFFSPHLTDSEQSLLKETRNHSMLTFSTHEAFLEHGGMIQLDINQRSNKLPISVDNCKLQRASLTLSSKVLRQAAWVKTKCNNSIVPTTQQIPVEGAAS